MDKIIDRIIEAADKTANSPCNGKSFIAMLFTNTEGLERCLEEDLLFLDLDVQDKKQFFSDNTTTTWRSHTKTTKNEIDAWAIAEKLREKKFVNFFI